MSRLSHPVRSLFTAVGIGAVAYAGTYQLPTTFKSYASLYFPQSQMGLQSPALSLVSPGSEGDAGVVRSLGGALSSPLVGSGAQTATGILMSQTCLREVIAKHGLTKAWDLPIDKTLRKLRGRVTTSVDKNGFLVLEVEAESPQECIAEIGTFMKHLDKRSEELSINVSRRNREIIEQRVKLNTSVVAGLQSVMVDTMANALVTNLPEVQRLYLEARQQLSETRIREASALAQMNSLERSLKQIYARGQFPSNLGAIQAANASLTRLTDEIQSRRLSLEEIGASFQRESPEYRAALKGVRDAESVASKVLAAQSDAVTAGLTPELAQAKAELAALSKTAGAYDASLSRFEKELAESPEKYAAVTRAESDFQTALASLAKLKAELEMARLAEIRDPSRYEVVDAPFEDREPASPRRALLAGAAFLLAFAGMTLPWVLRRLKEDDPA